MSFMRCGVLLLSSLRRLCVSESPRLVGIEISSNSGDAETYAENTILLQRERAILLEIEDEERQDAFLAFDLGDNFSYLPGTHSLVEAFRIRVGLDFHFSGAR